MTAENEIRGIVFDKDGTLLDFHATWIPAYRRAAEDLARQAGEAGLADALLAAGGYDERTGRCAPESALACGSNSEIAALWAPVARVADVDELAATLSATFYSFTRDHPVPVTQLGELFARLRPAGLAFGMATMDTEAGARATLDTFGIAAHFSFVCGYDSGFGEKPGPGMVQAFCRRTGLEAGKVAVVGDTPHDMHMARAAGAGLAVGVLTGAGPRETLTPLADIVLASIEELDGIFL